MAAGSSAGKLDTLNTIRLTGAGFRATLPLMKFAFSTLACPKWDLATIAAKACEYGYDGVEIRAFLNENILTTANVFLTDPAKVRELFARAGAAIACLSTSVAMTGDKGRDRLAATDLRHSIDVAATLGTGYVKIFDLQLRPGQNREAAAAAMGQWLRPLADYAAEKSLKILVENQLSFRRASELWLIIETAAHPAVAACWDVLNAALAGERPAVSVPTLNSRIELVQVKDAYLRDVGANYCKLGDGDLRVPELVNRLKGIGYDGWISFEFEKAWLANLAEPEESLAQAIAVLREMCGMETVAAEETTAAAAE
ncbi:MAG: sugar phosphate isomerase/epimerase [Tepidisphaeraceae bacterium]